MTVYVGDIQDGINFLRAQVDQTPDFDQLSPTDKATLRLAAETLQERLGTAIAALDAERVAGGLSGAPIAASGDFSLDTAAALDRAIKNSTQAATLVLLVGHVGRLQLNLEAAG